MAIQPNWKKTFAVASSIIVLGYILRHSNSKGLPLLSWVGGGSIVIGGYRVAVEAADFLDHLADRFYWSKRKPAS
jgi:hypothetical protein